MRGWGQIPASSLSSHECCCREPHLSELTLLTCRVRVRCLVHGAVRKTQDTECARLQSWL